ncbi:Fcf1 RNA processing protein [Nitzschia inconspicua]|uniref:Fcf1 RNA processing protein n=1 Tax=Nitzschia inconspicua TaxID=303405 RepID=A0A9K3K6T2_9STRA|nr:Fcf1 RNA processing protein [Nitzschia inconspicua]KAG7339516.1 Fcf1 RNA processing protein [Nitzschia inconspicua]KAG7359415.1 Fcf1 RNA processing protein [Nitzschia inconspicua]
MRHGRAKSARKTLQYFKQTVGLQTRPYLPVLLDGCFLVALFQYKIPAARIEKVLQIKNSGEFRDATKRTTPGTGTITTSSEGRIKYFVTAETVTEMNEIQASLEKRNHDKAHAFQEATKFIRQHCTVLNRHEDNNKAPKRKDAKRPRLADPPSPDEDSSAALSPQEALLFHVGHEGSTRVYVVATQDESLLDQLRAMGTVPIMRLANNSVLLLEQPSKASQKQSMGEERRKWKSGLASAELALVELAKEQLKATAIATTKRTDASNDVADSSRNRKKRKAKGPNPLSCKRKQA